MAEKYLFQEFPNITPNEWRAKVEKDLKGRAFEELQWQLNEKTILEPFYTEVNGNTAPALGRTDNNWQIAEDFHVSEDLKADNKILLDALMGGIDAPRIFVNRILTTQEWAVLLNEVKTEYISLHLRWENAENLSSFQSYLESQEKDFNTFNGSVSSCQYQEDTSCKTIHIDAGEYFTSIAEIPQELANTLEKAVQILTSSLEEHQLQAALSSTFFTIQIGKSYFPAIAKLRALRILWERICKGFEVEYVAPEVEVTFSPLAYGEDNNTNMIRATTMAMAAILGGADRLIVLPNDALETDTPSSFSRRIARNVQHLLKMESFMDKVVDPAAGSYYIEEITNHFVEQAWQIFLDNSK